MLNTKDEKGFVIPVNLCYIELNRLVLETSAANALDVIYQKNAIITLITEIRDVNGTFLQQYAYIKCNIEVIDFSVLSNGCIKLVCELFSMNYMEGE